MNLVLKRIYAFVLSKFIPTKTKKNNYYKTMENLTVASSSISPLAALLWCIYPIGILVLIELVLGGGYDDDNDDQDGGMLIPAYAGAKQN